MKRFLLVVSLLVNAFSFAGEFECSAYVVLEGKDLPPFGRLLREFKSKLPGDRLLNPDFSLSTLNLDMLYDDQFYNYCVLIFAHGKVEKGKFQLLSKEGWIDAGELAKKFPNRPHVVSLFSCYAGASRTSQSFPDAEKVFVAAPENDVALDRDVEKYLFHIISGRGEISGDPELIFDQWKKADIKAPAGPIRYGHFNYAGRTTGMVRRQDDPYADDPRREEILQRNLIRIRPRKVIIDD